MCAHVCIRIRNRICTDILSFVFIYSSLLNIIPFLSFLLSSVSVFICFLFLFSGDHSVRIIHIFLMRDVLKVCQICGFLFQLVTKFIECNCIGVTTCTVQLNQHMVVRAISLWICMMYADAVANTTTIAAARDWLHRTVPFYYSFSFSKFTLFEWIFYSKKKLQRKSQSEHCSLEMSQIHFMFVTCKYTCNWHTEHYIRLYSNRNRTNNYRVTLNS